MQMTGMGRAMSPARAGALAGDLDGLLVLAKLLADPAELAKIRDEFAAARDDLTRREAEIATRVAALDARERKLGELIKSLTTEAR